MKVLRALGSMAGFFVAVFIVAAPTPSKAELVLSNQTSFCLDAKGASSASGTPIIMYWCNGGWNQKIQFTGAGEMRIGNKCLDASGGTKQGAKVVLWDCHGGANQKWRVQGDKITQNGLCLDVWGGSPAPWTGVQLWQCNGGKNQSWRGGRLVPAASVKVDPNKANAAFQKGMSSNTAGIISNDGGGIVSGGAGNIIAAGGGNVIASGGNIVAGGAGN